MNVIPIIIFFLFVLGVCYAFFVVARKSGAAAAYAWFSWAPLALGIVWVQMEFSLAALNPVLPYLIVILSLVMSLGGLPFMLATHRGRLSPSKVIGLAAVALLYGLPALLYITLSITGTR